MSHFAFRSTGIEIKRMFSSLGVQFFLITEANIRELSFILVHTTECVGGKNGQTHLSRLDIE